MIAGSRDQLVRVRSEKTVQNWESETRTAKTDEARKVVPSSALTDLLLARWRGKQPPPPEAELREMLDLVIEFYKTHRGRTPEWAAVKTHILSSIRLRPAIERYRPIAGTGAPPGP